MKVFRAGLFVFLFLFSNLFLVNHVYAGETGPKDAWRKFWNKITSHGLDQEKVKKPIKPVVRKPVVPAKPVVRNPVVRKATGPLSKEEMIDIIKVRLHAHPYILNVFPDILFRETSDGEKAVFYRDPSGDTVLLDDLDKDILYSLFVRIGNEINRRNTERTMKRIKQQEQLKRLQKQRRSNK